MTASLIRYPGFSEYPSRYKHCSSRDSFGPSTDFQSIQSFSRLMETIQAQHLQLLALSNSSATIFLVLWQGKNICISFPFPSLLHRGPLGAVDDLLIFSYQSTLL